MIQANKAGEGKDKPKHDEKQTSRAWEERIHIPFFFFVGPLIGLVLVISI